jgi:hypothetical protein
VAVAVGILAEVVVQQVLEEQAVAVLVEHAHLVLAHLVQLILVAVAVALVTIHLLAVLVAQV